MRSRFPLAGWVGGALCLLAGCTSDWSGHRLDSQSAAASRASRIPSVAGSRREGDRAKTEQEMTTPRVRTEPLSDKRVVTADVAPGRSTIGARPKADPQESNRVETTAGLFPARKGNEPTGASLRQADPEAAAIVDEELPDAPEEQKQGILADLQGMSPGNIRAMLRAWKQGLARRTTTPVAGASAAEAPPVTDDSATGRIRRSLSAGLGTVTAWGTAIVGGGKRNEPTGVVVPPAIAGTEPLAAPRAESSPTQPPAVATPLPTEARGDPSEAETPATPRNVLAELIELAEEDTGKLSPPRTQRERDEFISQHVSLRMLYLVGGRHELAMQAIPAIDPIDQEFWQHLFWGLANYFDVESIPTSEERAAEAASQLTQAVLKLQRRSQVEIRQAVFCSSVEGFGVYEPAGSSDFVAGSELLVYVELGNLLSLMEDDGQYRTRHSAVLELAPHGAEVDPVARLEIEEVVDLCRRQRRDYHQAWLFPLDRALPAGPYVLRLTVTDETNSKQATQTLNLRVQPAPPEEREVLERKPVIREEEPDPTLPAPRDPLQMQVRDAAGRTNNRGPTKTPAEPPVPKTQHPDEMPDELPEADSSGDKVPGEKAAAGNVTSDESSDGKSAEASSGDSDEEPVEDDAGAESDETPPPLPPIE
ncbi:MAG: hypothetical protein ACK6D3_25390 [Planctomycetaceae bacterium]